MTFLMFLVSVAPWLIFGAFWLFLYRHLRLRGEHAAELSDRDSWNTDRILDGIDRLEIQLQAMSERLDRLESEKHVESAEERPRLPGGTDDASTRP